VKPVTTSGGRSFTVLGDTALVTMDRLAAISDRLDSDPRIASVSLVAHPGAKPRFLRATSPAGAAIAVATDLGQLVTEVPTEPEEVTGWSQEASERGFWHDWWLLGSPDVLAADPLVEAASMDVREQQDLSSSRFTALSTEAIDPEGISLAIDATWLGPHETGAQVLTTAAVRALALNSRVRSLHLVGIEALPAYAAHLADLDNVHIGTPERTCDAIWYPNHIDQRVDMAGARELGRRVITTYLDLIAYDIPRYHASTEAWAAYRALQRRIALSVDGITTISADVAARLLEEVPRLELERVQPIPLGLDHITTASAEPSEDIAHIRSALGNRPFVLVLGNDFVHKNRDFALRVWEQLLERGVNCDIVFAGLHVKSSSSRDQEEALLSQHTNLRGAAHTVGHVSSASREWLLANAAAVIYPSSAEGFGFVPYEAAALGTPATFTAFGPLAEISQLADMPRTWSVDDYANDLQALLNDPDRAHARVRDLRAVIGRLTWEGFADRLLDFIFSIDALPPVAGALVGGSAADASALASVLSSKTWRATEPLRRIGGRIRGRQP
jgi:glycosyltransferase involved in cell wall biosynthesis